MTADFQGAPFAWVKDRAGDEFIQSANALRAPGNFTKEESAIRTAEAVSRHPRAGGPEAPGMEGPDGVDRIVRILPGLGLPAAFSTEMKSRPAEGPSGREGEKPPVQ